MKEVECSVCNKTIRSNSENSLKWNMKMHEMSDKHKAYLILKTKKSDP